MNHGSLSIFDFDDFFFMWVLGHDYVFVLCDEIDLSCMMVLEFYRGIGNGFVLIKLLVLLLLCLSNVWTLNTHFTRI